MEAEPVKRFLIRVAVAIAGAFMFAWWVLYFLFTEEK